jgi:hypothetical protein
MTRRLWHAPQVAPEGHASTTTAGPPLHIMIAGAPAAGKGTQCQRIVEKVLPEVAVLRSFGKQESWPGRVSHWRQAAMLSVCSCLAPGPRTAAPRPCLPLQGRLSACVGAAPAPDEAASGTAPVVPGRAAPHSAPESARGGVNSARSPGALLRGCSSARRRRRRRSGPKSRRGLVSGGLSARAGAAVWAGARVGGRPAARGGGVAQRRGPAGQGLHGRGAAGAQRARGRHGPGAARAPPAA